MVVVEPDFFLLSLGASPLSRNVVRTLDPSLWENQVKREKERGRRKVAFRRMLENPLASSGRVVGGRGTCQRENLEKQVHANKRERKKTTAEDHLLLRTMHSREPKSNGRRAAYGRGSWMGCREVHM